MNKRIKRGWVYLMIVQSCEEGIGFEFGKSDQFGSVIETGQHDGHHSVNVEEREDAQQHFLKRI